MAAHLEKVTGLKTLDISDIIAGRPEDEALAALRILNEALKKYEATYLDVSDNAFGAKGLEAIRDLLSKQTLKVSCFLFFNSFHFSSIFSPIVFIRLQQRFIC